MLAKHFAERGIAQLELPSGGSVPLRFSDPVREHLATRCGVGLFDFSFMGCWAFTGREALACLQRLQTRDLQALQPGRLCYTLLCREDGSVFIDATVWCLRANHYLLFTGRRSDRAHLERCAQDFDVEVSPLSDTCAVIAVQGPASATLLEQALPGSAHALPYFAFRHFAIEGHDAWLGRLGYTGELGYELVLPSQHAALVWSRLAAAPCGAERLECGMEAADSLRIEAGFIHFAYELEQRVLPAELGLSRLVRLGGDGFIGEEALRRTRTLPRRLTGVTIAASPLLEPGGKLPHMRRIVHLTSAAFSPLFGCVLGLGFVARDADLAGIVYTNDGRRAELARLPFRDPARALSRQVAKGVGS